MLKIHKFLVVLVFVFLFTAIAKADPIIIVSGTVTKNRINIQGENSTNVDISLDAGPIIIDTDPRFQFASGSLASPIVDGFGRYGRGASYSFRGNATINGIAYAANNSFFGGNYSFGNEIIFTPSQPIQLPTFSSTDFANFSVEVPFTMQGFLNGSSCPNGPQGFGVCDKIPDTQIYGSGIAKFKFFTLQSSLGSNWALTSYEYTFSTPEPTPEPATILLLGTGLAGVIGFARRKRKNIAEN